MKTLSLSDFTEAMRRHSLWIGGERGGERAFFKDVCVAGVDMVGFEVSGVSLHNVCLHCVTVTLASLTCMHLENVVMSSVAISAPFTEDASVGDANLRSVSMLNVTLSGKPLPVVPNIDAAILALIEEDPACFNMDVWRSDCGTVLCRAGLAARLAGEAGEAMVQRFRHQAAGGLIYGGSRPGIPIPDFFASNEDALKDIKACAARWPAKVDAT